LWAGLITPINVHGFVSTGRLPSSRLESEHPLKLRLRGRPTPGMRSEAASAGFYDSPWGRPALGGQPEGSTWPLVRPSGRQTQFRPAGYPRVLEAATTAVALGGLWREVDLWRAALRRHESAMVLRFGPT
jgi:hypothetical protein